MNFMNISEMKTALKTLNAAEMDTLTVDLINAQYKKIIENENLICNNTSENCSRLEKLRSAKKLLIENIDAVTSILVNDLKYEANTLFENNCLYEAKEKYSHISKMLPLGANISEYLSGDDCIRYGICCLKTGLRIMSSNSYLFSYGYGGRWCGEEWIDCRDYETFPSDWNTIENNISSLIRSHPMILKGTEKPYSSDIYEQYCSVKRYIIKCAHDEYVNQKHLKEQLFMDNKFLDKYINNNQGFFSWNGEQFYIYDDGNDNLYPIYRVSVKNNRIIMDFHKFSHFRQKKSGKVIKHVEFTVKIITDCFLQLCCTTGNIPMGYCKIACKTPTIDYTKYMRKARFTECPICGGKRILGICINFCNLHLEENTKKPRENN